MEVEIHNSLCSHVDFGAHASNYRGLESFHILSKCVQAAIRIQKFYRSYSTRRRLADSAVITEAWWQTLDSVQLNRSTLSFFDCARPETAISRWSRASVNAYKVGQGLSKDPKALKLASQHWIEAIDPRHRYGHNLHMYYEKWSGSIEGHYFFHWLDIGDGRNVDLPECPRSLLRKQYVKYLGPYEREQFEYIVSEGKIVHKLTGDLLDTITDDSKGSKWIFVMSTSRKLYAGKKKKGMFHHSSFLAGGVTIVAGRFTVENGILKAVWADSGHYKPSAEDMDKFLTFLRENGVDVDKVEVHPSSNKDQCDEPKKDQIQHVDNVVYGRTLSGGLKSPKVEVPQSEILKRIESKGKSRSYQLGNQLSSKWSTGAGPRIGCIKDYPMQLRNKALEVVNLSQGIGRYGNFTQPIDGPKFPWLIKLLKVLAVLVPVLAYWLYLSKEKVAQLINYRYV